MKILLSLLFTTRSARAGHCKSCSLSEPLTAGANHYMSVHYKSGSLQELPTVVAAQYKSCSQRELLATRAANGRSCSQQELLIARASYCLSCSLLELPTVRAAHYEVLTARASYSLRYSLLELPTVRAARCKSHSLQELLTARAAHCKSHSLQELSMWFIPGAASPQHLSCSCWKYSFCSCWSAPSAPVEVLLLLLLKCSFCRLSHQFATFSVNFGVKFIKNT